MTKKLNTVKQVMELSIQHHIAPDVDLPQVGEEWTLETHLDTLPAEFAAAIRAEMAKGTLLVSLVPGTSGIRVTSSKPRGRRSKGPAAS